MTKKQLEDHKKRIIEALEQKIDSLLEEAEELKSVFVDVHYEYKMLFQDIADKEDDIKILKKEVIKEKKEVEKRKRAYLDLETKASKTRMSIDIIEKMDLNNFAAKPAKRNENEQ